MPADEQRWLEYLAGYVATAWVTLEDRQVAVASVHAIAKEVDSDAVTDTDHESNPTTGTTTALGTTTSWSPP